MLVLARKVGQSITIGERIVITVLSVDGQTVRLGIEAPRELPVYRREIYLAICEENLRALGPAESLKRLPAPPGAKQGLGGSSGPERS